MNTVLAIRSGNLPTISIRNPEGRVEGGTKKIRFRKKRFKREEVVSCILIRPARLNSLDERERVTV